MALEIDIRAAVMHELDTYSDEVRDKLQEIVPEVMKEAQKRIRKESPKLTGAYAKGWRVKTENTRLGVSSVLYNAAKPGLTHLLENGHPKRNGGRVEGIPHIKPVEEWATEETIKRLEEGLQ